MPQNSPLKTPNLGEFRRRFPLTVENFAHLPDREAWLKRIWEIEERWQTFRENPQKSEEIVFYNSSPKDLEPEAAFEILDFHVHAVSVENINVSGCQRSRNRFFVKTQTQSRVRTHRDITQLSEFDG